MNDVKEGIIEAGANEGSAHWASSLPSLLCPVTKRLMKEPVMAFPCGDMVDKSALSTIASSGDTACPTCGKQVKKYIFSREFGNLSEDVQKAVQLLSQLEVSRIGEIKEEIRETKDQIAAIDLALRSNADALSNLHTTTRKWRRVATGAGLGLLAVTLWAICAQYARRAPSTNEGFVRDIEPLNDSVLSIAFFSKYVVENILLSALTNLADDFYKDLSTAIASNQIDDLWDLLYRNAFRSSPKISLNGKDAVGKTLLDNAISTGNVEAAIALSTYGATIHPEYLTPEYVNAGGRNGRTLLHGIITANQINNAQLLMDYGANVNTPDEDGNTPLHYAVLTSIRAVRLLLDNDADLSIQNRDGFTPFCFVVSRAEEVVVEWFLEQHLVTEEDMQKALVIARENGDAEITRLVSNAMAENAPLATDNPANAPGLQLPPLSAGAGLFGSASHQVGGNHAGSARESDNRVEL